MAGNHCTLRSTTCSPHPNRAQNKGPPGRHRRLRCQLRPNHHHNTARSRHRWYCRPDCPRIDSRCLPPHHRRRPRCPSRRSHRRTSHRYNRLNTRRYRSRSHRRILRYRLPHSKQNRHHRMRQRRYSDRRQTVRYSDRRTLRAHFVHRHRNKAHNHHS